MASKIARESLHPAWIMPMLATFCREAGSSIRCIRVIEPSFYFDRSPKTALPAAFVTLYQRKTMSLWVFINHIFCYPGLNKLQQKSRVESFLYPSLASCNRYSSCCCATCAVHSIRWKREPFAPQTYFSSAAACVQYRIYSITPPTAIAAILSSYET
jgi:hypothetical protein